MRQEILFEGLRNHFRDDSTPVAQLGSIADGTAPPGAGGALKLK